MRITFFKDHTITLIPAVENRGDRKDNKVFYVTFYF